MYDIYQVWLAYPNTYEFQSPVASTVCRDEAEYLLAYLDDKYSGLHFFITDGGAA